MFRGFRGFRTGLGLGFESSFEIWPGGGGGDGDRTGTGALNRDEDAGLGFKTNEGDSLAICFGNTKLNLDGMGSACGLGGIRGSFGLVVLRLARCRLPSGLLLSVS